MNLVYKGGVSLVEEGQAQIQRRILKTKYSFPKIVLFLFILLVLGGSLYFIIRNMDKIRDIAIKPENEFSLVTTFSGVGIPLFPNGILAVDPYKGMTFRASKRGSQILEGGIGNKKIRLESGFDKQKFSVTGNDENSNINLSIDLGTNPKQTILQIISQTSQGSFNASATITPKEMVIHGKLKEQNILTKVFERFVDQKPVIVIESTDPNDEIKLYGYLTISKNGNKRLVTGFVNNRRVGLTIEQINRDSYKISGMTINGPIDCTVSRNGSQWKISGNYADSGINLVIK